MSAYYTLRYVYPTHSVGNTIKSRTLHMALDGLDLVLTSAVFNYRKRGTTTVVPITCDFTGADVELPEFDGTDTTAMGEGTFDYYLRTTETNGLVRDYLSGSFTLSPTI